MSSLLALATVPLAVSKSEVGEYVNALFIVYTIMVLLNILISFVPRMPYHPWLRVVLDFITESTDPFLNIFRAMTKPIGGSAGLAVDVSPILALLALGLLNRIVVGAFF
jgi:uncharacterized protein YggT (Ycf19 family)